LARFIKHTTLTSEEIRSLPDNYSLAQQKAALPDLFQPAAGWLEVQMTPHRLHDSSNKYRRFARVFLKPVNPAMDRHELLERLRQPNFYQVIDSLALVVQNLLIDNTYTPIPSRLTTEFQLRHFVRDALGNIS